MQPTAPAAGGPLPLPTAPRAAPRRLSAAAGAALGPLGPLGLALCSGRRRWGRPRRRVPRRAFTLDELYKKQKVELRELCVERGLVVTGSKPVLAKRLANFDEDNWVRENPSPSDLPLVMGALQTAKRPKEGDIVTCTVEDIVDFGAFVRLEDSGLPGLIHIREISNNYVYNIEDVVAQGSTIEAMVLADIGDADRVNLSVRRLQRLGENAATREAAWRGFRYAEGDASRAVDFTSQLQRRAKSQSRFDKQLVAMKESIWRMEAQVTAAESILLQLGHGAKLRQFQEEISGGLRNMEAKYDRVVRDAEERQLREAHEKKEKPLLEEQQTIDAILSEIMSSSPLQDAAEAASFASRTGTGRGGSSGSQP